MSWQNKKDCSSDCPPVLYKETSEPVGGFGVGVDNGQSTGIPLVREEKVIDDRNQD